MKSSANGENVHCRGSAIDVAILEAELMKDKAKAKSNFTRSRNNLLLMVKYEKLTSRSRIRDACHHMDFCMETVMEVISNFTTFHIKHKDLQKANVGVSEMEKIETDFYAAYKIAWAYLDTREGDKSSDLSDCLAIYLEGRSHINQDAETDTCTYGKQQETVSNRTVDKVGSLDQTNITDSVDKTTINPLPHTPLQKEINRSNTPEDMSVEHMAPNHCIEAQQYLLQNSVNTKKPNQNSSTFIPTTYATPNIGRDLWTQLKQVQIPTFYGDKRTYPSWKAAFMTCVYSAPVTPEYKMLQLRQYVSGEALNSVDNLGYSPTVYEAAKDRLERKYGGKRRRKAIFLEDLEQFRQVQSGNAEELERFADLLDMTVINFKEAGEHHDLGDGSLYIQLQRKLPQSLLARYNRWLFEYNVTESVVALKTWVMQESHFQTIASETANGLTGQTANTQLNQSEPNRLEHRTLFIRTEARKLQPIQSCQTCSKQHRVWKCHEFMQKDVSERWDLAKRFQLCYRCLAEGHKGKSCRTTRRCGKNGCHKVHHRLLHVHEKIDTGHQRPEVWSPDHPAFGTEWKRYKAQRSNIECTSLRRGTSYISSPGGLECEIPRERRIPVDAKPKRDSAIFC